MVMTGKQIRTYPRVRKHGKHRAHHPNQGIGEFKCNVCQKKYTRYNKFDRFCNECRARL